MRETRPCAHHVRHCIIAVFSALLLTAPAVAQAQTVTAAWDASPPSDQVTGYQVCVGTSSLSCNVALASVSASTTSYNFTPSGGTLHYVAVRATNAAGVSSYSSEVIFSIPSFTQPLNQSSPAGTAIPTLNFSVNDPDGDTLTFTHTGLPPGLSLSASTGKVTGTPSAAGTYNVTVFVTDDLTTVSRSFVWTVTGAASDTTAPALTITSHTSGQTVSTTSATITGTATDSGRGGNGITGVTVNGQTAAGGTASSNNTANWSRSVTLSSGANTITVEATDGAGNVSMQQVTLTANLPIAPVTGATLTPSLASPRNAGTQITLTASGSGGVSPRQYKFLIAQGGGAAQTVQNWSTDATYTWTPSTAASYTVSVWARSAGVTTDAAQASAQLSYTINPAPIAPVTSATLTSNPSSPEDAGTTITFSAAGSGGVGPRQYKFLVAQGGGAAQAVQNWSTTATYAWTPSTAASYTVSVWVRSAGETTDAAQASAQMSYVINTPPPAPVTSATLTSNLSSPEDAFTTITFSAAGSGGVGPRQYKFLVAQGGGAAQTVQNWSTDTTYAWTPSTAASYTVSVWVRSAGVTTDAAQASAQMAYVIEAPPLASAPPSTPPPPIPTVQSGVNPIDVTPATGSGSSQTFALRYSDDRGAANLVSEWVWFEGGTGLCLIYHERATNRVYLLNDAGTAWNSRALGTNATLQNGSCSVALGSSSASVSGQVMTVNLAMAFTSTFSGAKVIKMFVNGKGGVSSTWQNRGQWTVSSTSPSPTPTPAPTPTPTATTTPTPTPAPPIVIGVNSVDVTPASGSGGSQTFALRYSDDRGASNLIAEWVWFRGGPGACLAYHERATNRMYLLNDAGTAWSSQTLGSGGSLQNSSCAIALGSSSASVSGPILTLNLAMTFTPAFNGAKKIQMFANGAGGYVSGWQERGSWTVTSTGSATPPPPAPTVQPGTSAVGVTPGSGSGSSQTFVLQYTDSRGATNLLSEWVWFSGGTGICMVYHERATDRLYLLNDAGSAWASRAVSSGGTLQNSSCAIAVGSSSASVNGSVLTLNLAMTFKSPFRGTKTIQMFASGAGGQTSGWQARGSWIVP